MTNFMLPKLNISLALIAVSTVLLSAFGVIGLFVAIAVLIMVFLVGFVSRSVRTSDARNGKGGANG